MSTRYQDYFCNMQGQTGVYSYFAIVQIKVYMDGIIDATTAAVKRPYNIDYNIYPQNKGISLLLKAKMVQ